MKLSTAFDLIMQNGRKWKRMKITANLSMGTKVLRPVGRRFLLQHKSSPSVALDVKQGLSMTLDLSGSTKP